MAAALLWLIFFCCCGKKKLKGSAIGKRVLDADRISSLSLSWANTFSRGRDEFVMILYAKINVVEPAVRYTKMVLFPVGHARSPAPVPLGHRR